MKGFKKLLLALTLALLTVSSLGMVTLAETQEAPVRDEGENYLGRSFNAEYDRMFDNFERNTIAGVGDVDLDYASNLGTEAFITDYHLRVHYSQATPTNPDTAIYKVGSPGNADGQFSFLVFEMSGHDGASIDDLVLAFRLDDNHSLIHVPFNELLDPDYVTMPEFTGDSQLFVIDLIGSLADKEFVHNTTGDEVPATNQMQGLHLYQDGASLGEGVLNIEMIYYTNDVNPNYTDSPSYYLLDAFEREVVSAGGPNVWWRDSIGIIIGKHLALDGTADVASYESTSDTLNNQDEAFNNVVFRLRGLSGGESLTITPIYDDGGVNDYGATIAFDALLGPDGQTLPAITTSFMGYVVSFEENGWDKDVIGFRIDTLLGEDDHVYVDQVFFTNMEEEVEIVDTEYPTLDPDDILVFDNFERDTLGATPGYDPNNPVALDYGFYFIIAYAGIDYMSVVDDELVFDADAAPAHMQYTAAASARQNLGEYDYVVFKVRGENGASLNTFRIATIDESDNRSDVKWGHSELMSGAGLATPQFGVEDYLYTSGDYIYLVVNIEETGLTDTIIGFDLFYSGDGQLFIDQIFFANSQEKELDEENKMVFEDFERTEVAPDPADYPNYWFDTGNTRIEDDALVLDATGNVHAYYRTAAFPNNVDNPLPYLYLVMKGDPGTTLESFRMNTIPTEDTRFFNAGHLIGIDGEPIAQVTDEYQTFLIDLEASGLDLQAEGYGLFFGDWDEGVLYIDETGFIGYVDVLPLLEATLADVTLYDPVREIAAIDTDNDVENITVDVGTTEATVLGMLPATIVITDEDGTPYTVNVAWSISNYDESVAGTYIATGTFDLPDGVVQTDPATPLEVNATITLESDDPMLDSIGSVDDIEVDFGTTLANAIAALPTTIDIEDTDGTTHTVNLTWTIDGYDGDIAGDYTATGTFTLPAGVEANPDLDENVTATVTVLEEDVDDDDDTVIDDDDDDEDDETGLSTGALVGIILGGIAILGGGIYFLILKP